jgi:hypothetical protein
LAVLYPRNAYQNIGPSSDGILITNLRPPTATAQRALILCIGLTSTKLRRGSTTLWEGNGRMFDQAA